MEVKNPIIKLFKSCDVQRMKNYSDNFYGPLKTSESDKNEPFSPFEMAIYTSIFIVILTKISVDKEKIGRRLFDVVKSRGIKELLYNVICILVATILLPICLTIFSIFKIHKKIIEKRLESDENFKGFIEGEDVVWMLENENSKSIINVLAYVNIDGEFDLNLPKNLLQSIRTRIFAKLVLPNAFPKMFYRTQKTPSGYFYWTSENKLAINDYVRYLNVKEDNDELSEDELKILMSEICNQPLPANSALWECLISRNVVRGGDDRLRLPVIFRVHHAVGDGVSLLRLFLETLADKESVDMRNNPILEPREDTFRLKCYRFFITILTVLKSPAVLCSQIMKQIDMNQIHPAKLIGNKKINWLYETDLVQNNPSMLTLVKLLKRQFPGARFSNILLAALSKSLRDFFDHKNYEIPMDMSVVIPARLYNIKEDLNSLKLENKFSVALQTLPIENGLAHQRIDKVRKYSDIVAASPDYQINYFMMSVVSAIFPDWILRDILVSKHATMAISNLPGPNFSIKINGVKFDSVGFFIPNVGQTAIGLSILSYNDKLHFGMMADEAAIQTEEDLGIILNGMIAELFDMAENLLK